MEELTIWEQHTATLYKDPRRGFGIAVSGGHDQASGSVVVSDVVAGGPAEGRLRTGDHIVMVNGVSVENVTSAFAIQILKTCTKTANVGPAACQQGSSSFRPPAFRPGGS